MEFNPAAPIKFSKATRLTISPAAQLLIGEKLASDQQEKWVEKRISAALRAVSKYVRKKKDLPTYVVYRSRLRRFKVAVYLWFSFSGSVSPEGEQYVHYGAELLSFEEVLRGQKS